MSATPEKMQKNAEKYRRRAAEIREDWTMSEAAKRHELGELYGEQGVVR